MMACIQCGCTDHRACMTPDGPCFWVSHDPPICSGCADDNEFGAAPPPAIGCAHRWLYTTPSQAHCVHCGAEHVEEDEAA